MENHFAGKSLEQLTDSENWMLEKLGLNARIEAESKYESFVSDGCTLNSVVYLKAKVKNAESDQNFDKFYELATKNARDYDLIIYLPPELPLVDDGFRPLSQEFRSSIDSLLLEILKDYKFHLVHGKLEERLEQINNIVKAQNLLATMI